MNNNDILGYCIIGFILIICIYVYFDNLDSFQLKCIVSGVDGNKYCVRERSKLQAASDLLASVTDKCKKLVSYVDKKHPKNENIQRLVKGFNPKKVMETKTKTINNRDIEINFLLIIITLPTLKNFYKNF